MTQSDGSLRITAWKCGAWKCGAEAAEDMAGGRGSGRGHGAVAQPFANVSVIQQCQRVRSVDSWACGTLVYFHHSPHLIS